MLGTGVYNPVYKYLDQTTLFLIKVAVLGKGNSTGDWTK
jgi:hypothetical protein